MLGRSLNRLLVTLHSYLPSFAKRLIRKIMRPIRWFFTSGIKLENGLISFDHNKPILLLVSHEDSRTTATIIFLNLAIKLNHDYNIVFLLLYRGFNKSIKNDFLKHASFLIGPIGTVLEAPMVNHHLQKLLKLFNFHFSIINSVESHLVLHSLTHHDIPTVTLIHEFASNTKLRKKFNDVIVNSTTILFGASIFKENFSEEFPKYKNHYPILPQGYSLVPTVMDYNAKEIEKIGIASISLMDQEKKDALTILESGLCRKDYYIPHQPNISMPEAVRQYIRMSKYGTIPRKLFPGFHPGIFKEKYPYYKSGSDALAQYLLADQPSGIWKTHVITENTDIYFIAPSIKIALHLHIYYIDLILTILSRLNQNKVRPDLFISVPSSLVFDKVQKIFSEKYNGKVIDIVIVPNKGRDIGPFFTAFSGRLTIDYDIIGHIHTKKTEHFHNKILGHEWFYFLLENLIGGISNMADRCIGLMANDQTIGLVFPDDPHVISWDTNWDQAEALRKKMSLNSLSKNICFPIGNMFWARTKALLPIFDLNFQWDDYPDEPLPIDGTLLHAIERIIPKVVMHQGYRYVVTNVKSVNR